MVARFPSWLAPWLQQGEKAEAPPGAETRGPRAGAEDPWKGSAHLPPMLPEGTTLTEVFLLQAARNPERAVLADATSGVKTYRDVITGILALKPAMEAVPGPYVGIMLPASVGSAILFLTALFAGKTPVVLNWTAGLRNMIQGLDLLGVQQVFTARALVAKLEDQGVPLQGLEERFVYLEDLAQGLPLRRKLWAKLRSYVSWASLRRARVADTAAVLFTSGSENVPKAVPLTHGNLLANLRDATEAIRFRQDDAIIGFLPPFHAFGLTCTLLLPLLAGLKVAYHPNPTEARALARLIAAFRCTLMVGTPTFLHAILRVARDEQLETLRLVVTGAEKCPEPLYQTIARRWPHMVVLEGYGITECSPVVSVNREERVRHCTIGQLLPSLRHAIVDPETGERVPGHLGGMLLVRGPSVFTNYLHHDGPSPFQELDGLSWYRTGDLVREDADGVLTFTGRLKRFVKLGGEMVSLPAVEEALLNRFMREEDTEPVLAVEATPAELNPDVVLFTARNITREEANATLKAAGLSGLHNIRIVHRLEAIPLLGTGKTNYRALKELLADSD